MGGCEEVGGVSQRYCHLVPNCCNKVKIIRKQVTQIFWFLSSYKSYIYSIP